MVIRLRLNNRNTDKALAKLFLRHLVRHSDPSRPDLLSYGKVMKVIAEIVDEEVKGLISRFGSLGRRGKQPM